MSLKFIIIVTFLVFIDHSIASWKKPDRTSEPEKSSSTETDDEVYTRRRVRVNSKKTNQTHDTLQQYPSSKGKALSSEFKNVQSVGYSGRGIKIHENRRGTGKLITKTGMSSNKGKESEYEAVKNSLERSQRKRSLHYLHERQESPFTSEQQNLLGNLEKHFLASSLNPHRNHTLDQIDPFGKSVQSSSQLHSQYPHYGMSQLRNSPYAFFDLNKNYTFNEPRSSVRKMHESLEPHPDDPYYHMTQLRISTYPSSTSERIPDPRGAQSSRLRRHEIEVINLDSTDSEESSPLKKG